MSGFKQVGYTKDGMVFVVIEGELPSRNGDAPQATQTMVMMAPEKAEEIAEALIGTAKEARKELAK